MAESMFEKTVFNEALQPPADTGEGAPSNLAELIQVEVSRQLQGAGEAVAPQRPVWMAQGRDLAQRGSLVDYYGARLAEGRARRAADGARDRASLRAFQRRRLLLERRTERLERELADARKATAMPVPLAASLFHARALTVALATGAGIKSLLPSDNEKGDKKGAGLSLPLLAALPVALFVGEREVRQEQARVVAALLGELEAARDQLADLPDPWEVGVEERTRSGEGQDGPALRSSEWER